MYFGNFGTLVTGIQTAQVEKIEEDTEWFFLTMQNIQRVEQNREIQYLYSSIQFLKRNSIFDRFNGKDRFGYEVFYGNEPFYELQIIGASWKGEFKQESQILIVFCARHFLEESPNLEGQDETRFEYKYVYFYHRIKVNFDKEKDSFTIEHIEARKWP